MLFTVSGVSNPMLIDIEVVAISTGLLVCVIRFVTALVRKEPMLNTSAMVPLCFGGAFGAAVGVCVIGYYYVSRWKPEWLPFFLGWPSRAQFLTVAGISAAMIGALSIARAFVKQK